VEQRLVSLPLDTSAGNQGVDLRLQVAGEALVPPVELLGLLFRNDQLMSFSAEDGAL
jgi:hypothetical protein